MSGTDVQKLMHELQVHQVELEMQNEELHRVQLELEASRDRFTELYDFAPVAYLTMDANGAIHEANLTAAALLGVARQNLISKKLSQFIHRESQDVFYLHQQRVFTSRRKQACELSLRATNGSRVTAVLESIISPEGEPRQRRCLAVLHDITERNWAQELVQNISTLPEENPNPTLRISAGGILVYGNPASLQCQADLGWEVGRPVTADWLARIRAALKRGMVTESEISLGARTYFCTVVPFAERGFVNLYGRDITARKQAETALRQSEERFRTLASATFEGIAITENGRLVDCNEQLAELLGYEKNELLGKEVARLIAPEDRARVLPNIRAGRESHVDHDMVRKDGSRRSLEAHGHTITYQGRAVRITAIRDITPRKQAEAALREARDKLEERVRERTAELEAANQSLRESEQRFSQVVENIEEVFWMTDVAKRKMFFVSAAYERIWGRSRESLYATLQNWLHGIHRADRARIRQAALTKQAGGDYDEVYRVIRPDGTERWIHDRAFPIRDASGAVYRIAGIAEDITERKLVEAALLESKHFFQSALDALSAHIGILDATGRIVSVNAAWQRFAQVNGLTLAACGVGANYLEICDHASGRGSAEAAAVARGIRKVMARHAPAFQLEYPCHSAKELRWFVVRVTRFEGAGPVRLAVAHENITERKQMEEALRRSEQELADFFEHSPMGLLWVKPDGGIFKLNRAQQELFGYRNKDVIGHRVAEFFLEKNHVTDRLANGETVRDQRAKLRQKDGTFKYLLIDANGLWAGGRLIHSHWFVRDITRRVELEREILGISEREQLRMSQDLHDDLGQQLTGIQYLTDTLAGKLEKKSTTESVQAREIAALVRNAMSQTRELAHGLFPVSMDAEGLADALKQLAARISRIFCRECRFHYPAPVLMSDHTMGIHLYRIAQEAVSNAIRHGKARRIEIALTRTKKQLVLKISDQGAGLPRKPKNEKGMGLRIMQYRAGVIGGALQVQRRTGGGTEVVCTLPNGHLPKHTKRTK